MTVKARLRNVAHFWYDFVVGDDWRGSGGGHRRIAATYGLTRTSIPAWWLLPVVVALLLPFSLWREGRRRRR